MSKEEKKEIFPSTKFQNLIKTVEKEENVIFENKKQVKKERNDGEENEFITNWQEFKHACIGLDKSQVDSLKKLLEIFPFYKIDLLKQILEKKKWYYEDAASLLIDQQDDISIERDDSFEIGEDVLEITFDSNITNEYWYKEALQSANEYLKELGTQKSIENFSKKQDVEYTLIKLQRTRRNEEKRNGRKEMERRKFKFKII